MSMKYSSNVWRIRQTVSAGNDFDGSHPSRGGDDVEPEDEDSTIWDYPNLDGGGLFDFDVDKSRREVKRIWLDLGDAASWHLDIVTFDSNDGEIVQTVIDQDDYTDQTITLHGRALYVLDNQDFFRLHTTDASEEMFASIMTAYW